MLLPIPFGYAHYSIALLCKNRVKAPLKVGSDSVSQVHTAVLEIKESLVNLLKGFVLLQFSLPLLLNLGAELQHDPSLAFLAEQKNPMIRLIYFSPYRDYLTGELFRSRQQLTHVDSFDVTSFHWRQTER